MDYPTKEFIEYAGTHTLPSYVKTAQTKEFTESANPKTKSAVYLAVFSKVAGTDYCKLSEAELGTRASWFGIGNDCAELIKNLTEQTKQASAVEPETEPEEEYPVRSPEEWTKAASWLQRNAYCINVPDRQKLAAKLIKTAQEFGLPEPDEKLYKHAGIGMCDPQKAAYEFLKRSELIGISKVGDYKKRAETVKELEKFAALIAAQPTTSASAEWQIKLAAFAQFVDNEYDLSKHYGHYISEPDEITYGLSYKKAEHIQKHACTLTNGNIFDSSEFTKLGTDGLVNTFSPEFVKAVTTGIEVDPVKLAKAAPYLEEAEADLLSSVLADYGITPKLKTAAHRRAEKTAMYALGKFLTNSQ
jgi:hypothetical protein